jgi:hypothetical protein
MPDLTLAMVQRSFSDEEIKKILGLNIIRLFERVWGSTDKTIKKMTDDTEHTNTTKPQLG